MLAYRFWTFLERLHVDLFCYLYRQKTPALSLYYFPTLDSVEHLYYRAWKPEGFRQVTIEEIRYLGGIIPEIYGETDRALGRLRECVGDQARVVVVSDHGMRTTVDGGTDPVERRAREGAPARRGSGSRGPSLGGKVAMRAPAPGRGSGPLWAIALYQVRSPGREGP